jgi:teichuronic acid biosynthesis glycosyltransferase TuaH
VTAADPAYRGSTGRNAEPVVLSLAFETFADTVRRRSFSPDLLAERLLNSRPTNSVLIADPWRSFAGLMKRTVVSASSRSRTAAAAAGSRPNVLHPIRLRRNESFVPEQIERNSRRYVQRLVRAAQRNGMQAGHLIVTHPHIAAAVDRSQWKTVTYYGWDDWAAHPALAKWHDSLIESYRAIGARQVKVAAVSRAIVDRIASPAGSLVVPNGLRADEWLEPVVPPDWLQDLPRPILLYSGTVDSRLDIAVIRNLAQAFLDGTVLIVGTIADPFVPRALADLGNVVIASWQPREVIRGITFDADVALIAHVDTDLTRAMSPLKVYEYLAAGRPVVASDLEPLRAIVGPELVSDPLSWVPAVRRALKKGPAQENQRHEFVAANTWETRMDQLIDFATGHSE